MEIKPELITPLVVAAIFILMAIVLLFPVHRKGYRSGIKDSKSPQDREKKLPGKYTEAVPSMPILLRMLPDGTRINIHHLCKIGKISYYAVKIFGASPEKPVGIEFALYEESPLNVYTYQNGNYILAQLPKGRIELKSWDRDSERHPRCEKI
jgi:hypothetical protein